MVTEKKDKERIAKVIARAGLASRRGAEKLISEGRVKVNGEIILSPALNLSQSDRVLVDNKVLPSAQTTRLWRYNKPVGLVTSEKDEKNRKVVFDNLPKNLPRVMSIGRLDLNSEGLLLLTNDGDLKRKLELPSTGWSRKYRVRINGNPSQENLEPLRTGITLNNEKFKPMTILIDRQQGANAWLTITLKEGRNREIRRALNEIGFKVSRLIRISYGPFKLDQLKPNEVEEIKRGVLRDQLNNVFDLKADANLSVKTKKRKIKNSYSDLQNPSKQIKHRRKLYD
ncbi:MAG: pseudouridine synthase [Paracoccaceae bacterium]|nr:pseudouridine synthase [Paracoccaceae bacterium]